MEPLRSRSSYIYLVVSACLLLQFLTAGEALAIRLTLVRHLFDITQNFREPSDVAVSRDGMVYVVDGVNNRIKAFQHNGRFAYSFGGKGRGSGEFEFPLGIAVDESGRIYVADSGNQRVQIFGPSGTFLSQIKMASDGLVQPDPTDVSVTSSMKTLYVVDNNNHHIHAYDLETGKLKDTFGSPGEGNLEFRYPFLMTTDRDDYLYVVDVINTRVQVLNPEGLFVANIGGWGVEKGEFFRPKGVAVDARDRIYVSDSYMGVIQVFDHMGEFYSAIGDSETRKIMKFTTPAGIFIDSNDRLYVVEMFAEKVSVYSITGDTE